MDRDNCGSISKNKDKNKDSHPDYKGKLIIDGKKYWVSGWIKKSETGQWLSLAVKPVEERDRAAKTNQSNLDDGDPF